MRRLLSTARRGVATAAAAPRLYEWREYVLHPGGSKHWHAATQSAAGLRARVLPGWLGMWTTDTGGDVNTVRHLYAYSSIDERARVRAALAIDGEWQSYLDAVRPHVASQTSSLFVGAADVHEAAGARLHQAARASGSGVYGACYSRTRLRTPPRPHFAPAPEL